MDIPTIISFQDALGMSEGGRRHLLLGNGFSIDWKEGIFQYGALVEQADFSQLQTDHKKLFSSLNTQDFEQVMRALQDAAALAEVYATSDPDLAQKMRGDAEKLKDVLVKTIAQHHPELPNSISVEEYTFCRRFLANFSDGKIYTLNYDLLLYWTLMHDEFSDLSLKGDDGFRKPEGEEDYVVWNSFKSQNIYYLHGALHLFNRGYEVEKFTWVNTGIKLMEQIRNALDQDRFPLIVTEGTKEQKMTRITHSGYLHKGFRSFEEIGGTLFIHGHSLTENDNHFIDLLPKTKVEKVFVSLFNPGDTERHIKKYEKMAELVAQRQKRVDSSKSKIKPLHIHYYDAATAHVWR